MRDRQFHVDRIKRGLRYFADDPESFHVSTLASQIVDTAERYATEVAREELRSIFDRPFLSERLEEALQALEDWDDINSDKRLITVASRVLRAFRDQEGRA